MAEKKASITIWFLCGLIILVYGLAVTGSGIYNFFHLPDVVGASLHLDFWWGLVLIGVGLIFLYFQWPSRIVKDSEGGE